MNSVLRHWYWTLIAAIDTRRHQRTVDKKWRQSRRRHKRRSLFKRAGLLIADTINFVFEIIVFCSVFGLLIWLILN